MQRSALCRSRRELSNAYLLAKFRFDTAENEPCKVCRALWVDWAPLPRSGRSPGCFTILEPEVALLGGHARLAVHSLKDVPTQLPEGLVLGAVFCLF